MLEALIIPAEIDKPEVKFDPQNDTFEISGKSMPEDVKQFFDPIIDWLEKYAENPIDQTTISVNLNYFNSSTARKMVEVFSVLEEIIDSGKKAGIIWQYNANDELMKERGEEYQMILDVPVEMKPV